MSTTITPHPDQAATPAGEPSMADQAPILLSQVAGYVGFRTVALGLRAGLVSALAAAPDGLTPDELAERLDLDPFYVAVWSRGALAAGVCDRDDHGRYRLAPHLAKLLLDTDSPAHVGGVFEVLGQPEVFDRFAANLATGERMWWDETSPHWIAGVAGTGRPFYTRLVPHGLAQITGLADRLAQGGLIVDTACGAGEGLVRLATHFPASEVVGVDGDAHSLELAARRLAEAGLTDRVTLRHQPLEELALDTPATLVINNISMHECRDIDEVTRRIRRSLEPGGWFVVSDFPFPDSVEGLRTLPGRIMSGIQFFEAQIDDQLLPRSAYDDLLARHGFSEIGSLQLTPMHALTHGRA
jgi:ubiquinone/menaquinone biosynthesis C-methylase UbiE